MAVMTKKRETEKGDEKEEFVSRRGFQGFKEPINWPRFKYLKNWIAELFPEKEIYWYKLANLKLMRSIEETDLLKDEKSRFTSAAV